MAEPDFGVLLAELADSLTDYELRELSWRLERIIVARRAPRRPHSRRAPSPVNRLRWIEARPN
jgi:hypothetical protein